jgi:hypothetical protein
VLKIDVKLTGEGAGTAVGLANTAASPSYRIGIGKKFEFLKL